MSGTCATAAYQFDSGNQDLSSGETCWLTLPDQQKRTSAQTREDPPNRAQKTSSKNRLHQLHSYNNRKQEDNRSEIVSGRKENEKLEG